MARTHEQFEVSTDVFEDVKPSIGLEMIVEEGDPTLYVRISLEDVGPFASATACISVIDELTPRQLRTLADAIEANQEEG